MAVLEREAAAAAQPVPLFREPRLWTRDEYYKMAAAGILGPEERVELIEGEVIKMAPIGPEHNYEVDVLSDLLRAAFGIGFRVRSQGSVSLGIRNEPQPDIAVYVESPEFRTHNPGPDAIRLIVEVADSSFAADSTGKMAQYAHAAIAEYWIADIKGNRLIVHREPDGYKYSDVKIYYPGQAISALHAPGKPIAVSDFMDAAAA